MQRTEPAGKLLVFEDRRGAGSATDRHYVRWLSFRSFSSAVERRNIFHMNFRVEIEQEEDGRWIAEVVDRPGVLAYGSLSAEAQANVQVRALRVVADRLEHGEAGPDLVSISFAAA